MSLAYHIRVLKAVQLCLFIPLFFWEGSTKHDIFCFRDGLFYVCHINPYLTSVMTALTQRVTIATLIKRVNMCRKQSKMTVDMQTPYRLSNQSLNAIVSLFNTVIRAFVTSISSEPITHYLQNTYIRMYMKFQIVVSLNVFFLHDCVQAKVSNKKKCAG